MALHCDTVAGRLTPAGVDTAHSKEWTFLAEPGAAGLLRALPESCRDRTFMGCLMRAIDAATPPEPIVDAYREMGVGPRAHNSRSR